MMKVLKAWFSFIWGMPKAIRIAMNEYHQVMTFSIGGMFQPETKSFWDYHLPDPKPTPKIVIHPLWVPVQESLPEPDRGFIVKLKYDYLIIKRGFREAETIKRWFDMDVTKVAWCYFKDGDINDK